jgi:hypothetical protein
MKTGLALSRFVVPYTGAAMSLPPCPWCKTSATVRREHGGWVAGCPNYTTTSEPPTDCLICPNTTVMNSPRAAVRAWATAFQGAEIRQANNFQLMAALGAGRVRH